VQTVLERLEEDGSTPNVVALQKSDWEMVGKNLFVDVYVANRGGGDAKDVKLTLSGIGLAAGEGEGWTCEWHPLADDSVEDGAGARCGNRTTRAVRTLVWAGRSRRPAR